MLSIILFFACFSLSAANPIYASADCVVSIKYKGGDLKEPQPLILTRNSSVTEFLYPTDNEGTLRIPAGQTIHLSCPGKTNYFRNIVSRNEVKAVCVKTKIFNVDGVHRNFSSLMCKYMPEDEAKQTGLCLNRHSRIEIGFNVTGQFLRTLEVCRDDKTYTTYYSKFRMTRRIAAYQKSYPRPNKWSVGPFYSSIDVEQSYKFDNQFATIARILNSTELARTYMRKSVQFLSRGHMSAKADFVYGAQQMSTFWYLNAAPQWQSFNGGNWNTLEVSVRNFAANRNLDLDVYTGVHGQMTLIDAHGKWQSIALQPSGTNRVLHAPRFYWKVIYDPVSKKGTAFVGLNDPFVKSITRSIYLCTDISSNIKWLKWNANNIAAGICYACTVDDLRKAVPTIPPLKVNGLLV